MASAQKMEFIIRYQRLTFLGSFTSRKSTQHHPFKLNNTNTHRISSDRSTECFVMTATHSTSYHSPATYLSRHGFSIIIHHRDLTDRVSRKARLTMTG